MIGELKLEAHHLDQTGFLHSIGISRLLALVPCGAQALVLPVSAVNPIDRPFSAGAGCWLMPSVMMASTFRGPSHLPSQEIVAFERDGSAVNCDILPDNVAALAEFVLECSAR
jgi:hypothetical protein